MALLFVISDFIKMNYSQKPLFFFYLLVGYVLVQFFWWSYLLVDLNKEIAVLSAQLHPDAAKEIQLKLSSKYKMIMGEGVVFFSLLILGFYQTKKAFSKEKKLSQQQKNFVLSVTHELKSPLASIRLQLETLLKRELNKDKSEEIIKGAIKDSRRLHQLVDNILTTAEIENDNLLLYGESVNISELIEDICNRTFQEYEGLLNLQIETAVFLTTDRNAIHSIVSNLIENALKYSNHRGPVTLKLYKNNNKVVFSVADNGPGIPENEISSIFQKFYRIGNEETRKSKGTGLGLFIVKYLCNLLQAKISVRKNEPQGVVFEIEFNI